MRQHWLMQTFTSITLSIVAMLALALGCSAASANTTQWQETEGGRVRLLVASAPQADGSWRGAIDIELEPGWKTYWRDPGGSGVPPQIDLIAGRGLAEAQIAFPPPQRIGSGTGAFAGYTDAVRLPVVFVPDGSGTPPKAIASVFLGICADICIPFQAEFEVDPLTEPNSNLLVNAAFMALPGTPNSGFEAVDMRYESGDFIVRVRVPEGTKETKLFVASDNKHLFDLTQAIDAETFRVPILGSPRSATPDDARWTYVLEADGQAVEGSLGIIYP
jgi:DsbC/DsbD-like thiol-disulfide interchange protein